SFGKDRKAAFDGDERARAGSQRYGERVMIVAFVAGGAFFPRRESRQSRALGLGLRDGDGVELGFFRARKSNQMAAVVDHGNAHMAVQCVRSVDGNVEYFHRAFPGQLLRCDGIHRLLLIFFYTMTAKKTPAWPFNTRNVSATMVLMITGAART